MYYKKHHEFYWLIKATQNLKWMSFKIIYTRSWVMNKNKNEIQDIWFKLYMKK